MHARPDECCFDSPPSLIPTLYLASIPPHSPHAPDLHPAAVKAYARACGRCTPPSAPCTLFQINTRLTGRSKRPPLPRRSVSSLTLHRPPLLDDQPSVTANAIGSPPENCKLLA